VPTASRFTAGRAKSRGRDPPRLGEACDHAVNAAGLEADGAEQESLLAEQSEAGSSLADKKVESALVWKGYTPPLLCKCNDFNAYGVFGRDSLT
jgi:hypothetical protein